VRLGFHSLAEAIYTLTRNGMNGTNGMRNLVGPEPPMRPITTAPEELPSSSDSLSPFAYLYLRTFSRAVDRTTPPDERKAEGQMCHALAISWDGDSRMQPDPDPTFGDWIRMALRRRIDGVDD
jgi:hypothetical protein